MLRSQALRLFVCAIISCTLLFSNQSFSQAVANPDTYCYEEGQTITDNVLSNDIIEQGLNVLVVEISTDDCFRIDEEGFVQWTPLDPSSEPCCGIHILEYYIADPNNPDNPLSEPTQVEITVKCPKPDCNLIDLSSFLGPLGSIPGQEEGCVSVCEDSDVTFFVQWNTNNTYQWSVSAGGTGVVGSNPAEYIVSWGAVGSGFISLQVTDASNVVTTVLICVDILPKPVASFTTSGYACLDQCLQFTNTSVNADQYFWDFGDGNTSAASDPCHPYANPGTYTVTLTATNQNFAADGSALCCCTDVFTFDVEIDPLPGPPIYWISTLCEGDEACYWTTATNCASYAWTVFDANGVDITTSSSVSGLDTDTICVNWAIGPVGTISLLVSGCDSLYCNNPSTVQVPIIPSVSTITGPIVVCANSTEVYSLPKWLSTDYEWTVTGGTVSGSGHSEPIQWGSPGTGTIQVNYSSAFLQCTDGHDESDCSGVATLNVTILPSFDLINPGPSEVCVGSTSSLSATSLPSPNYNWTVSPSLPANVEVGNGTDNFSITWGASGTYVITAQPTLPNVYCNDQKTKIIKVIDVPPPSGITGPIDICPGEAAYYTAVPNGSGFGFSWTALNGTPSASSGATVGITWGATGPYSLTVVQVQQNPPFCQSLPISITPLAKGPNGPYTIQGGPSCLNELTTYTLVPNTPIPAPHPDVVLTWSLSDPTQGSIVSGQGTSSIQVQWGNTPGSSTVQVGAELCGITVPTSLPVVLTPTQVPVISQVGLLCPGGGPVTLNASAGFSSYLWSNLANTQSTTTSSAGQVSVTTTDPLNGCQATAYAQVATQPGPVAEIYSNDGNLICLQNPAPITMIAQTSASYQFTWYCSGPTFAGTVVVQGPSSTANYTHNVIGTAGTYTYYFTVTDLSTGCTNQSPNYLIIEETCSGSGSPCIAEQHTLAGFSSVVGSNCDQISFGYTSSNFTFGGWSFGDGNGSTNPAPTHTYSSIGCYTARVCGTVPEDGVPGSFCTVCFDIPICVPLKADFSVDNPSCGVFNFTDLTTFLPGPGNGVLSYAWTINGIPSSTSASPSFTITTPSTVELTVTNGNGCKSVVSTIITPNSVANPTITAPTSICMNESFNFSVNAPGAVSYAWTFGTSTFGAQAGQFAYVSPPTTSGPNVISVIVTDAIGCQGTASVNITVFPEIPPGAISAAPDLVICQGSTTTLSAPSGYSYLWSPGNETTQSISVGMGVYGVTLTDSNGCTRELDEVEVEELPLPDASISGNLFICDAGCTVLSAPNDPSNTYEWLDNVSTVVSTGSQITVCVGGPLLPGIYSVRVTDQNGCSNTAGPVTVQVATSPSFTVSIAPVPACAGQPTVLGVTPFDPTLNYAWSTGATTPTITVSQAGTYSVIGTDPVSGCSSSASETVHPLPDLCLVPEGCYDICPPKTICGPSGLDYQWNLDGIPIPGETDSCLTVISSGDYSLTATNQFGCIDTSGRLILNVLDCPESPCDSLTLAYEFLTTAEGLVDSCCLVLSYDNQLDNVKGLHITTSDGDLNLLSGSLSGLLNPQSSLPQFIALTSATAGNPIPQGILSDFATICIENAISTPQVIYFEWLNMENEVICNDSIVLNCPVEPDCIFLASDSIYCEGTDIKYDFTVCNPSNAAYPVGYIDLLVTGPAGILISPPFLDLSSNPLLPGNCQSFTLALSGPGIEGQEFCFNIVGHEQNPIEFPGTLCCSLDTLYCIDIPFCDPCPFVQVEGAIPVDGDGCCYDILLINNFTPGYFDEIGLCVLSPQTSITVNNPIGSGWLTSGYTGTSLSFLPDPIGAGVPTGAFALPRICFQTNVAPMQQIEVKWMKDGDIVCRDTLDVFCEPPCGYLSEESTNCEGTSGNYIYQALLNNNSGQTVTEAFIEFTSPAGLGTYNQTVSFAPLFDGQSVPINFNFGPPALPGDTVCFTVTLHSVNANGVPIECCQFEQCLITPQCPIDNPTCTCDVDFEEAVNLGFAVNQIFSYTFGFSPNSSLLGDTCNIITWVWGDGSPSTMTNGASSITHTFPTSGKYQVCMIVIRINATTGEKCEYEKCLKLGVPFVAGPILRPVDFTVFPNPGNGLFVIAMPSDFVYPLEIHVADINGKEVKHDSYLQKPSNDQILLNLSDKSKGVYFIRLKSSAISEVKKVIIN